MADTTKKQAPKMKSRTSLLESEGFVSVLVVILGFLVGTILVAAVGRKPSNMESSKHMIGERRISSLPYWEFPRTGIVWRNTGWVPIQAEMPVWMTGANCLRTWKNMDNRRFVFLFAILLLLLTVFVSRKLGVAFIPSTDNSDFYVDMRFPRGYSLKQTEAKTAVAERIVRECVPEMRNLVAFQGRSEDFSVIAAKSNEAYFYVNLVPVKERSRDIHALMYLEGK